MESTQRAGGRGRRGGMGRGGSSRRGAGGVNKGRARWDGSAGGLRSAVELAETLSGRGRGRRASETERRGAGLWW